MPECAKAHLQQSRISKIFWGGSPDHPLSGEAVREEEKQEKGEGEREGKGGGGMRSPKFTTTPLNMSTGLYSS